MKYSFLSGATVVAAAMTFGATAASAYHSLQVGTDYNGYQSSVGTVGPLTLPASPSRPVFASVDYGSLKVAVGQTFPYTQSGGYSEAIVEDDVQFTLPGGGSGYFVGSLRFSGSIQAYSDFYNGPFYTDEGIPSGGSYISYAYVDSVILFNGLNVNSVSFSQVSEEGYYWDGYNFTSIYHQSEPTLYIDGMYQIDYDGSNDIDQTITFRVPFVSGQTLPFYQSLSCLASTDDGLATCDFSHTATFEGVLGVFDNNDTPITNYTVKTSSSWNFAGGASGGTGGPTIGGVPEPASWALMVAGFGLVGGALRRKPRSTEAAARRG